MSEHEERVERMYKVYAIVDSWNAARKLSEKQTELLQKLDFMEDHVLGYGIRHIGGDR